MAFISVSDSVFALIASLGAQVMSSYNSCPIGGRLCHVCIGPGDHYVFPPALFSCLFLNSKLFRIANILSVLYLANLFAVLKIWNRLLSLGSGYRFCIFRLTQIVKDSGLASHTPFCRNFASADGDGPIDSA